MKQSTNPMGLTRIAVLSLCAATFTLGAFSSPAAGQDGRTFPLWVPFSPPENPPIAQRQILGKILFWDEQLSSDNTMSCGTCHIPSHAGNDPRVAVNPSYDNLFMTEDDVLGSPGMIQTDENGEYLRSVLYELLPQVTDRRSMPNFIGPYSANLFWDGRAEGIYVDPVSEEVLSSVGVAATEIQALVPLMNDIEMAHQNRTWPELLGKLGDIRPLALASNLPQDMLDAIEQYPSYPELFEQAFGTPEITPGRIGFAIANYQRTLVPDQSPWDLWNDGDEKAMTQDQLDGYFLYRETRCNDCHTAPFFTSLDFAVDGVRPVVEDMGRAGITGANPERGAFKMGTLRNAGLRDRFMHTGGLQTLDDVFDFYGHRNGHQPFADNLDFRLLTPISIDTADEELIKIFINEALTDPRLANEEFPFDRPTLHSELPQQNPMIVPGGNPGSAGHLPRMIAVVPPNIGNTGFKVGLDFALGGAQAWVAISTSQPTDGRVAQDELIGPITLNGMSAGDGYGTMFYPLDDSSLDGETFYMQWIIADPNAPDGFARSNIARVTPFCTMIASCSPECIADLTGDGSLDFFDVSAFLDAFNTSDPAADLDGNGVYNFFDVSTFLNAFSAGCP